VPFQDLAVLTEHETWPYSDAYRRWCNSWHQNQTTMNWEKLFPRIVY